MSIGNLGKSFGHGSSDPSWTKAKRKARRAERRKAKAILAGLCPQKVVVPETGPKVTRIFDEEWGEEFVIPVQPITAHGVSHSASRRLGTVRRWFRALLGQPWATVQVRARETFPTNEPIMRKENLRDFFASVAERVPESTPGFYVDTDGIFREKRKVTARQPKQTGQTTPVEKVFVIPKVSHFAKEAKAKKKRDDRRKASEEFRKILRSIREAHRRGTNFRAAISNVFVPARMKSVA